MIKFANLIRRYSVSCQIVSVESTWNDDGEPIRNEKKTPHRAAILPIDAKLMQIEAGRYTTVDKAIYSLTPLTIGDLIEYKGGRYTIDQEFDYSEYTDYNKYTAKRVTTHG